ncbi:MAG: glycosyltransferase family 4 protein [Chloroherpetonaceae bacterium]|nr:glycosyltransferase family 4 protein [Chthonomonadaceae bacterium]MDW8209089.1 glycosyltransferase family 4 protein [Chloroherpetonaceae bacterium]
MTAGPKERGVETPLVFFYPHAYLRDRQLDTIRRWPRDRVLNPEIGERRGAQVSRAQALSHRWMQDWRRNLWLLNVKMRPRGLPAEAAVYVWGGLLLTGPFIVDVDNPYAFTGYNLRALSVYRPVIRRVLLSSRCLQIRCMSEACRQSLRILLGEDCGAKAVVTYPYMPPQDVTIPDRASGPCRFVFVGTQFEIKGGAALLRAFRAAHAQDPNIHLDVVTHLPAEFEDLARSPGITVHPPEFTRQQIIDTFFRQCDVLLHPTYMESFGMVILEAMSFGLALVATDVYAIPEMVFHGVNGYLLQPPISVWDGVLPSEVYYDLPRFKQRIRQTDTRAFEQQLTGKILELARDRQRLYRFRCASLELFHARFASSPA